jgi:hypothetical protein
LPAVGELRVNVEVPEPPAMEFELRVAVSPADGLTVKATVPAKLLMDVIVMVEVVDCPTLTADGDGAVRMKS